MKTIPFTPRFRVASQSDIPFITSLLSEFYSKAGAIYGIKFDAESTVETVNQVLERGVCLVGPSSCAGAIMCRFPYGKAVVGQIAFWYFQSAREIQIFDALMKACKARGATHINASSLYPDNRIERYYVRNGFTVAERQAIRAL